MVPRWYPFFALLINASPPNRSTFINLPPKLVGGGIANFQNYTLQQNRLDARVTMELDDSLEGKISRDSTASILTSGLLGEQYVGLSVGGDPEMLEDGDTIRDTQQALVLEQLIQQFVSNMAN